MLDPYIVLNSVSANGVGRNIFVKDMKYVMVTIATSGLSTGKEFYIKSLVSAEAECPNFSLAHSITNLYDTVEMIKFPDGTPIDGDSGDLIATDDDVRMYKINVDGMTWMTLSVENMVGAGITILGKLMGYDVSK